MDERMKQMLLLGREHYAKREFDQAETVLREILARDERFADVHQMLGVIAHADGNFIAAERHFERALEINPNYTEAALNLAVTYNDRGKYDAAREVYARIKGRPAHSGQALEPFARGKIANMHADLAQAYVDSGLVREGIAELEKALNLCPDFADLRTRLGALLREVNDVAGARAQYEAAVAARPNFVAARIQLGVVLLALGEADGAEREWKQALEIEPENPHAKMYVRMLATQRAQGSLPPSARPEDDGERESQAPSTQPDEN
jgi:tetratricopeptide (TPR) repeat protein